jgi:hypothetical protein
LAGFVLGIAASFGDKLAFYGLAVQAGHGLDVEEALTLGGLAMASFDIAFQYISILFLGCAAVVGLRAHAFPGWLAWSAAVIAGLNLVSLLVPPTVSIPRIGFPLFFLWLLAASALMLIRPETPAAAVQASSPELVRT